MSRLLIAHYLPPDAAADLALQPTAEDGTYRIELEQAVELCRWLRERRWLLQERHAGDTARDLERVARRWVDPRARWLPEASARAAEATGYAQPAVAEALSHLFRSHLTLLRQAARRDPAVSRTSRAARRVTSCGPALTLLFASGNVPVAALPSVVHAFLARSPCLARVSAAEQVVLPLFGLSLWEIAPILGGCFAVLGWPSEDAETTGALLEQAEAVIAYGSDVTLAELRARTPIRAPFVGCGHRIGFGAIGREALTWDRLPATAAAAARDVALFDQQGCMSPQWFYVERGGEATTEEFSAAMAEALERLERKWPRRPPSTEEASAVHQRRAAYQVRADAMVWASPNTEWTVVHTPDPAPEPGGLNRFVLVKPLENVVRDLPDLTSLAGHLQSVACALPRHRQARLVELLAPLGATRFCPIGQAQYPMPTWLHDGVNAVDALLRWVEVEG